MSRSARGGHPAKRDPRRRAAPPPPPPSRPSWAGDLAIMAGAFIAASLIAAAAGATNAGTALTFGTIAFAAALLYVLLRR